jgi:FixJ family two-component response regulator
MADIPAPAAPTVAIVEDDPAVRDALISLVASTGRVVAAHDTAESFIHAVEQQVPDCVLLDIRLPGMDGMSLLRWLVERLPAVSPIVLTGHGDVPMAVSALRLGAFDFVEKPFDPDRLLDSIGEAIEHGRRRARDAEEMATLRRRMADLTPREREVMEQVTRGMSNKMVALELKISPRTVEIHRANVMEKMQARTISDLVRMTIALEARER